MEGEQIDDCDKCTAITIIINKLGRVNSVTAWSDCVNKRMDINILDRNLYI